jgi:LysM repeat protein
VNGFDVKSVRQSKKSILVPTPLFAHYFLLNKVTFKNLSNIPTTPTTQKCGDGSHQSQYTASYGDTLATIAQRFRMKVDQLMDLNPLIRSVRPGMLINLC